MNDPAVVVAEIRSVLMENGGGFDDPHTADAHRVAEIARLVGFEVERDQDGVLLAIRETMDSLVVEGQPPTLHALHLELARVAALARVAGETDLLVGLRALLKPVRERANREMECAL